MNANKFSDSYEIDHQMEINFYRLLGLKPNFRHNKPERFFTYYLMLKDIIDVGRQDMFVFVKCGIIKDKCINKIFKILIEKDTSSLLNNYNEIISHYENEDLKEMFFT